VAKNQKNTLVHSLDHVAQRVPLTCRDVIDHNLEIIAITLEIIFRNGSHASVCTQSDHEIASQQLNKKPRRRHVDGAKTAGF
jgi:hypothetical protein